MRREHPRAGREGGGRERRQGRRRRQRGRQPQVGVAILAAPGAHGGDDLSRFGQACASAHRIDLLCGERPVPHEQVTHPPVEDVAARVALADEQPPAVDCSRVDLVRAADDHAVHIDGHQPHLFTGVNLLDHDGEVCPDAVGENELVCVHVLPPAAAVHFDVDAWAERGNEIVRSGPIAKVKHSVPVRAIPSAVHPYRQREPICAHHGVSA
mmetsp:Transcript_16446/g.41474  ORF Transcript_16446/g.41474 Transcript_16446/m.41474 type:complete len:211 (+) Transcript_16446:854-1486(+)